MNLIKLSNFLFFHNSKIIKADKNCKDPFNGLVSLLLAKKKNEMDNSVTKSKNGCCKNCEIF